MADRKLTLIFEADTRTAITGIRTLIDEVGKLKALTDTIQNTDFSRSFSGLTSASQTFTASLTQAQGRLQQIQSSAVAVSSNIQAWQNQTKAFNQVLDQSIKRVKDLGTESKKAIAQLSKPVELKLKASLESTQLSKAQKETTREEGQVISQALRRQIERENKEIRANLAKQQATETQKSESIQAKRTGKAEQIISKLNQNENSFFKSDEITKSQKSREFATQTQIEAARQNVEMRKARVAAASTVFGTVTNSANENRTARADANTTIGEIFGDRLQRVAEQKRIQESENKQRQLEGLRKELAEKTQKKEVEFQRLDSIKNARRKGLSYQEDTAQNIFNSSGTGFGASRLKTSQDIGYVPGAGMKSGSFALDAISRRAPQGVQDLIQGTQSIAQSLNMGTVAAYGLGAAISAGIVGAIALANFGIQEFGRQLQLATKDQLALIGISSETQRLYGVSRKEADNFYETLQTRTEIAGRDTSVDAQAITQLNTRGSTGYLQAFKSSGRSLDDLSKQMVDTNTRFAILAQSTPGVTNFQVQNAYTSAVSGNLGVALTRQEFFKNSGFGEVVKETAKELGIDLAKATQIQQIDVLQKSLEKRVPQSLIDRAQNDSIEAQVSSFTDRLFAQRTGVFGIQRDLDLDVEGNQSLFTEISRTVKLILGKDGLFSQIGQIFGGVDFDILKILRGTIRYVNDFLEGINTLLAGLNTIKNLIGSIPIIPGIANLGQVTSGTLNTAGEILFTPRDFVSRMGRGVNNIFSNFFGGNSAEGNLPGLTNSKSFFQSINDELNHKPLGSKLLIANDSEYIFPDINSLKNYTKNNFNNRNSNTENKNISINPGAIVVNGGNSSPQNIAEEVVKQLDLMVNFSSNLYV